MMMRVKRDAGSRMLLEPIPEDLPPASRATSSRPYVELWARTNFSFLRGASSPRSLVAAAVEQGYDTLGITDCDGLYGIMRAMEAAEPSGMRLVVGCELTLDVTEPHATLVVHVANHAGYQNLCRILTESHRLHPKGKTKPQGRAKNTYAGVPLEYVCQHADGLWALALAGVEEDARLAALKDAFGERLSLAAWRHRDGSDRRRLESVQDAARRFGISVCATNAVRFAQRADKPVFDVLHCIREGQTLNEAGRALAPNAEACLKSPEAMQRLFADEPTWITRSRDIADACRFSMTELEYSFPFELGTDETADAMLRRLTYEGGRERYRGEIPAPVVAQIEKELDLITKLRVAPFFLSVWDIIGMARRKDILCQGRGSAANSAVCYCLAITALDPTKINLLFERFLTLERNEPPDIDVDFEHERREEVIQEIYSKYGRDRAAMVSEVVCYRGKSALREVGKVFGLSLVQVDALSQVLGGWDGIDKASEERLREVGFDPRDRTLRLIVTLAGAIQGFPRHLSIHVGGFVLSAKPLAEIAPVEPATMPGRTIVPWDKDDLDKLGFFKVDVLGLGILTAVRKCLKMAQDDPRLQATGAIDQLARIPSEDPTVYDALCRADAVGVFQVESRAQMSMLPRLQPREFYDLVVEVAIVRPGPIQGGMVHPYLRRRAGKEAPDAPHPSLEGILNRTKGVPIFQEQVMQIAIVGAGYSGSEADQLRRDMAAWRRNGKLERHAERLMKGFAERGIAPEFATRLYEQIQGFGEYGFPESHAASFALIVYATAWLKVHHPAEFAAALINSQPMGFYAPATLIRDAQRHGVETRPLCVHASEYDVTLEPTADGKKAMRMGLRLVRGIGESAARRIEAARPFTSIDDLGARAGLSAPELQALAESGALAVLQPERRVALWKVRAPRQLGLFEGRELDVQIPRLPHLTPAEELVMDYQRTGVALDNHPMLIARPRLSKDIVTATGLEKLAHGQKVSTAGLVICRQRPMTASGVVFITLEDETGWSNAVVFNKVFERYRHVATTSSLLVIHGTVERSDAVIYVMAEHVEALQADALNDTPNMSHDFH